MIDTLQHDMLVLKTQLDVMFSAVPLLPDIGPFVVARVTKGHDLGYIWWIGLELIAIFVGAAVGETVARRLFRPLHRLLPALDERSDFGKLGALLVTALVRFVELGAFGLVAISLFFAVYEGHEAARYAFWALFLFVVLVQVAGIALRLLLAPNLSRLRLPSLDDKTARRLYRLLLLIAALVTGAASTSAFLHQIGLSEPLYLAFGELMLVVVIIGMIAVIWGERHSIAQLIGARPTASGARRNSLAGLFAVHWHVFATCFLVAMGIVASVDRLVTGERQVGRILATVGILIGFPLIDGLMRMAVRSYFAVRDAGGVLQGERHGAGVDLTDVQKAEASVPTTVEEAAGEAYGAVILRNGRVALAVIAVVLLSRIWEINLSGVTSGGLSARVAEALFQIAITLLLASSAWSIAKIAIKRHLPREELDPIALVDEESSGSGLSRLETLLPLVRMFLFVTIVAIALMSVISAMGVNIGPLLAGAGIVGVAVGFGSQTLVRDVLSGIFFLFDDAFRIGEYVDVGEGKGTVERMSIRALILRHQLGQLNTIPFGVIRRVTNFSRDWTIMKLEIRVPFDTDLELLRKVVKQTGQELLADPEHGPSFIQPLKSQGVNRIDDSAFVVRVKFMAKPNGEAFVLRRQVFRRLQEAFRQSGIEFASRRVVVEEAGERAGAAAAVPVITPIEGGKSRAM